MYKYIYNKNLNPKELSQINKKKTIQFFLAGKELEETLTKRENPNGQ